MTEKIYIFDTTLRDGEQSPGASMNLEEKVQIAEILEEMKVDIIEAGYAPEMAYFECLHEVKLIVDLLYEGGMANMRYSISNTAEYGDYSRGPRLITDETRKEMKKILKEIQSGEFAQEWMEEHKSGQTKFKIMREEYAKHPIEKVGEKLRTLMPWIAEGKMVDKSKN